MCDHCRDTSFVSHLRDIFGQVGFCSVAHIFHAHGRLMVPCMVAGLEHLGILIHDLDFPIV